VVAISKESEAMVENMRKLTREQMLRNNAHTEEQMQKKAEEVANRLKELDLEGQSRIQNVQKSTMEKVADIGDRAQDSFYRPMQLNAQVKPDETGYTIQIPVVAHEAEKLFVTTEGKSVKLSLARSFANQTDTAPGVKNRTQSHQSVTEIIQLPDILDGKSIQREYSDGLLTLRIKRA
jgi:HSP20 family molecular chaperone IbpA